MLYSIFVDVDVVVEACIRNNNLIGLDGRIYDNKYHNHKCLNSLLCLCNFGTKSLLKINKYIILLHIFD